VLRFLLFFAVLASLLVLVGLPAVASPVLTQMVRDGGLRADELHVSVGLFDPGLVLGRVGRLRIEARRVALGPADVAGLDLTLGGVDLFDRTFETISGNVRDVDLTAGGLALHVERVDIDGPARSADVAGYFGPQQSLELIRQAARRMDLAIDDVRLVDGAVRLSLAGFETNADVSVDGGALVLRPDLGPRMLLLQPAPSDPWRLTGAEISRDGLTVRGVVDVAALAHVAQGPR
jgi:hypothetical protein